jgi:hypothetical protein
LGQPHGRKRSAVATSLAVERSRSFALSSSGAVTSSAQLVRGLGARLDRRTPHHVQGTHDLCGTVDALGLAGSGVCLERSRGGLGVGGVVFAEPAAHSVMANRQERGFGGSGGCSGLAPRRRGTPAARGRSVFARRWGSGVSTASGPFIGCRSSRSQNFREPLQAKFRELPILLKRSTLS